MSDDRPPIDPRSLVPKPGHYLMSLVKDGVEVPVKVWETGERDSETGEPLEDITLFIDVNGVERDDGTGDIAWLCERVVLWGTPITEADYRFKVADADWCERYEPSHPKANPRKPIDLNAAKPLF